jgi:hypothetical protein
MQWRGMYRYRAAPMYMPRGGRLVGLTPGQTSFPRLFADRVQTAFAISDLGRGAGQR